MWVHYSEKELYDKIYKDIVEEKGNGNESRELVKNLDPNYHPTVKLVHELYDLDNEVADELITAIGGEEILEEATIVAQYLLFQDSDALINIINNPETTKASSDKMIHRYLDDFRNPPRHRISYILAEMTEQEKIRLNLESRLKEGGSL